MYANWISREARTFPADLRFPGRTSGGGIRKETRFVPKVTEGDGLQWSSTDSEERWGNEQRSAETDWRGSERLLDKLGQGASRGEVDFVAYLSLLSSLRATCSGRRRAR